MYLKPKLKLKAVVVTPNEVHFTFLDEATHVHLMLLVYDMLCVIVIVG